MLVTLGTPWTMLVAGDIVPYSLSRTDMEHWNGGKGIGSQMDENIDK